MLEHVGSDWVLVDDGLSRTTTSTAERLQARRRLRDGDVILVGSTAMTYRAERMAPSPDTMVARNVVTAQSLSPTQRLILLSLCRPYRAGTPYATPATNQQIADEIFLSVDAVKTHLRTLFQQVRASRHLPQNQKRARLVELGIPSGLVPDGSS